MNERKTRKKKPKTKKSKVLTIFVGLSTCLMLPTFAVSLIRLDSVTLGNIYMIFILFLFYTYFWMSVLSGGWIVKQVYFLFNHQWSAASLKWMKIIL